MRLAGQHALITGGGTGIGAAIARALGAEGAKLTLVGRRRDKLEEVASGPYDALVAPCDVTNREAIEDCFALAREAQGSITILVNNAGAAESAQFAKTSDEAWRAALAVNLDAVFHCCQAALPDLLAAENGRIVTVASTAGLKGYAYTAAYAAAKHGAVGLTRVLAAEFARTNLTVNAVCPGFTDTDLVQDAIARIRDKTGRSEAEARAELARFNPQGRLVTPQEVANAVLWLCLPDSRSVTGQALVVAGGEVT
ncbi:MAG: SDR family NAD(P)-dependent oxidoreductase [Sphingosinicella sp.]|uniref:SDR family NAD(P)-dependent oxidoreductase n=1 Tax=Sphingosinicella sp. TaxID=1917971 RepID=UPI004037D3C5